MRIRIYHTDVFHMFDIQNHHRERLYDLNIVNECLYVYENE